MNGFDFLLIAVLVAFAVTGWLRGFVLETFSLLLWPLSAFVGWSFMSPVDFLLEDAIVNPELRLVSAFSLVFVLVFVTGSVGTYLLHQSFRRRGYLRMPNSIFGGLVGFARGGVIIVIVFLVAGITTLPQRPWWRDSALVPFFQELAVAVGSYLPQDVARHIHYG